MSLGEGFALVPVREHICLECRTALAPGEVCAGGAGHRAIALRSVAGREELVRAVWGGVPRVDGTDAPTALVRSLGGFVGAAAVAGGFLALGVLMHALVFLLLGALAALATVALGLRAVVSTRRLQHDSEAAADAGLRRRLRGGARRNESAWGEVVRGTVRGDAALHAPGTGRSCLAWALTLRVEPSEGPDVLLADAVTSGFEVDVEGGDIVQIPPGRIHLEAPARLVLHAAQVFDEYIHSLDPLRVHASTIRDPFSYDVAAESTIRPGDRVVVATPLDPAEDRRPRLHREVARRVLRPRGIPRVRLA